MSRTTHLYLECVAGLSFFIGFTYESLDYKVSSSEALHMKALVTKCCCQVRGFKYESLDYKVLSIQISLHVAPCSCTAPG